MRVAAVNEIDFERRVAEEPDKYEGPSTLVQLMADMEAVGATHITTRRLSEALGTQRSCALAAATTHPAGGLWSLEVLDLARKRGAGRDTGSS